MSSSTHVITDYTELVQVLFKRRVAGNRQVGEETVRVAQAVVVGRQHLRRHRLTEAAAARHTAELLLRAKRFVTTAISPDLSTYSLLRISRNALFPLSIYMPIMRNCLRICVLRHILAAKLQKSGRTAMRFGEYFEGKYSKDYKPVS